MENELKRLLLDIGHPELISLVGNVPASLILKKVFKDLPPHIREGAKTLIEKEEQLNATRDFVRELRRSSPAKFPTGSVLEAMLHGIHPKTYEHNKVLPLQDKLKLPVWEAICALNIKEGKNGNKTTERNRKKRI